MAEIVVKNSLKGLQQTNLAWGERLRKRDLAGRRRGEGRNGKGEWEG